MKKSELKQGKSLATTESDPGGTIGGTIGGTVGGPLNPPSPLDLAKGFELNQKKTK